MFARLLLSDNATHTSGSSILQLHDPAAGALELIWLGCPVHTDPVDADRAPSMGTKQKDQSMACHAQSMAVHSAILKGRKEMDDITHEETVRKSHG